MDNSDLLPLLLKTVVADELVKILEKVKNFAKRAVQQRWEF